MAEPQRRRLKVLFELGPKRRREAVSLFDHALELIEQHCVPVAPSQQEPAGIAALLRTMGGPDACHVVGGGAALDGRDLPLGEALDAVVGKGRGAFLSCLPGRLGFFEFEDIGRRCIVRRA